MKIDIIEASPVRNPVEKVVIELDESEAINLRSFLGHLTSKELPPVASKIHVALTDYFGYLDLPEYDRDERV